MSLLEKKYQCNYIQNLLDNLYWYHSFVLPQGYRVNGAYNLDSVINYYGIDKNLKDKTVLDVGTADGYLAFYCEKLGAKVTAVDIHRHNGRLGFDPSPAKSKSYQDKYQEISLTKAEKKSKNLIYKDILKLLKIATLNNFFIIADLLDSKAKFEYLNVYELSKLKIKFDLVLVGDLIEHLKNPLQALEEIRRVTKEKCIVILSSPIDLEAENLLQRIIRRIARYLSEQVGLTSPFLERLKITNSSLVSYHGNEAGGSFFHFSVGSFKEALLASGFRTVNIYSKFKTKDKRYHISMKHIVYHCFP